MVQHVHRIHPKFKLSGFRDSHTLDQVHVQLSERRPFDRRQAKSADLPCPGIHEYRVPIRVSNRFIAEGSAEPVLGLNRSNCWIRDLLESGEVRYAVCHFGDLPALRKIADDIRSAKGRELGNR